MKLISGVKRLIRGHTGHLVELGVVDEVGPVPVDEGAERQAVLPASPCRLKGQKIKRYTFLLISNNLDEVQHSLLVYCGHLWVQLSNVFHWTPLCGIIHTKMPFRKYLIIDLFGINMDHTWTCVRILSSSFHSAECTDSPDMKVLYVNVPVGSRLPLTPQQQAFFSRGFWKHTANILFRRALYQTDGGHKKYYGLSTHT